MRAEAGRRKVSPTLEGVMSLGLHQMTPCDGAASGHISTSNVVHDNSTPSRVLWLDARVRRSAVHKRRQPVMKYRFRDFPSPAPIAQGTLCKRE